MSDAALADGISALLDLPNGSRLFRYERDDDFVALTSPALNEYIAEHLGPSYTAKDFRTWGGTLLAAKELARRGPARTDEEAKRVLAAVMRRVGDELGNTAAVARASYVSPVVVEHYLVGRTLDDARSTNGSASRHLTAPSTLSSGCSETPVGS